MQDILKKYRKHKYISNITIVLSSLVLAFGINIFLIDSTNMGQNLKANILGANQSQQASDIYLEKQGEILTIKAGKNMKGVETLSFSLAYNAENLEKVSLNSNFGPLTNISNEEGLFSIILNVSEPTDILPGEVLVEVVPNKIEQKTEHINLINANFKDTDGEIYLLSTSGITF